MNIKCLFGYHDWGRQENIREIKNDLTIFLPVLLFLGPTKECDQTCLRCDKQRTIQFDNRRGT